MAFRVRFTMSRLVVASLVLSAGVVAASFRPGVYERLEELWPSQVHESAVSLPPGTFTPIMSKGGDWYTSAGCIHEEFYLAWDGSEVSFSHLDARSPAQAAEQMRKWITLYSEREAERSDGLDEKEMKVGERVTGLRRTDTMGRERVAILWVRDSDFFTVEGESLGPVLEFERQKFKR